MKRCRVQSSGVQGLVLHSMFDVERSMFDVRHLPSFFLDQTGCFLTRGDAYMKLRCRVQSSGFWVQGLVLHSMFDVERSMFDVRHLPSFFLDQTGRSFGQRGRSYGTTSFAIRTQECLAVWGKDIDLQEPVNGIWRKTDFCAMMGRPFHRHFRKGIDHEKPD